MMDDPEQFMAFHLSFLLSKDENICWRAKRTPGMHFEEEFFVSLVINTVGNRLFEMFRIAISRSAFAED